MEGEGRHRQVGSAEAISDPSSATFTPLRLVFGIDLRTLALFRVLLGLYLIADLCLRSRDIVAFYTDFGVIPRDVALSMLSPSSFSIHLMNGSATFQATLFMLAGLCAVMLIIGWRTRLATFLCWALLLSLQNRNTVILSGEDNLAILLLFWAMFLPLGARYSVDSALDESTEKESNDYWSIAATALLLQGMSMYFFSALLKTDPIWVPDGTAVFYALHLDYFATPFALWFRQFEALLQGLTYYVWTLELIGPFLIFSPILHRPLRAILMACFMTMHIGFWMCLEIGLFPLISIIMNLTFMPGWMWDGIERRLNLSRQAGLRIWYDRDCAFCRKMCQIIATFLFLRRDTISPAQDDPKIGALLEEANSWVVSDGRSEAFRWEAMCRLVTASPIFWPLAPLLGLRPFAWIGNGAYRSVARNRETLAAFSSLVLARRRVRIKPSHLTNFLAVMALVFVTIQNISTLPSNNLRLSSDVKAVRQFLGLYQFWTMFAPYPELNSPWPIVRGQLTDGTVVDVYNLRLGEPSYVRPPVVSKTYASDRWRKFLSNVEDQSYENVPQRLALTYGRYLCRRWTAERPDEHALASFVIVFNVDRTRPPGTPKDTTSRAVWTHDCFA